jgi:hypothetical protein
MVQPPCLSYLQPLSHRPLRGLGGSFFLVLGAKVDGDAVHTMPLILGIPKLFAFEDMAQVPSTVVAHDLRPHHAEPGIRALANSIRERVPEGRPAAAGVELVVGLVERRAAAGAGVHAGVGVVLVELAGAGRFGSFLAEDAELLW